MSEPAQEPRFGPIRTNPPRGVVDGVGAAPGATWSSSRLGGESGYPNGGMWRFSSSEDESASVVVKRTGPRHLGTDHVWRGAVDPADPQWWGREATFYLSRLAVDGWDQGCRAARCLDVDDHDGARDLWLEDVAGIPLPRSEYEAAVTGLARWQVHHRSTKESWLSAGWIPTHLHRRRLDNDHTVAHPAWSRLIDLGVAASARGAVRDRVTDRAVAAKVLDRLPQLLTHYDFHNMNLGQVDGQVVIIDWSTVGWGPVGHDVGFLLIDQASDLGGGAAEVWDDLARTYATALRAAGCEYSTTDICRSVAISNVLRQSWIVDLLLTNSAAMQDQEIVAVAPVINLLASFQATYVSEI